MLRPWRRPVLSYIAAAALAVSGAVLLAPAAQAADADVKINEINHVGTDFVELVNTGAAPVDISGFKILDNDGTHTPFSIPAATTLNPGVRMTFEAFGFGLGDGDSVTLFAANGTTVLDTFAWVAPGAATTSWSRCPDSVGAFAISSAVSKGTPNVCSAGSVVKINEIESLGGTPGDWVELKNTDTASVDVSGFKIKDSNDANVYSIPAATTIGAGSYLVVEEAELGFSLDDSDSVRFFATDGTTVLDSFTWTFPAATTTFGRCADGIGNITKTQAPTKGATNSCISASAWPGGSAVSTVDPNGFFGQNMSGLAYEGNVDGTPGALWAVKNNVGTLYRLLKSGSSWVTDTGDWTAGKVLHFANGTGNIDAEGVTFTDAGSAGGMYVAVERDNGNGGVSRPSILRFDPNTAGTVLNATNDWDLTSDLPGLGSNLGPEAIAWVPDSYLTGKGFKTTGGTAYNPADFPNHGAGLFLVGIENTGNIYAYALNAATNAFTRVASFDSGFPAVMELHFEKETQKLWVVCDDTCQGRSARFDVDTNAGVTQGTFVPVTYYERPSGMANLNNEGFSPTPRSECVAGTKPVFWADDAATGGNAIRTGTLNCTVRTAQTVTFGTTAPTNPVVGQTYSPTASSTGSSGNPVVVTIAAGSAGVCTIAAGVVTFNHPGSCVVKADQAGNDDFAPGTAQQSITVLKANTKTVTKPKATTIEATVSVLAPGVGSPTGTVLFAVDGTNVGSAALAGDTATLTYTVPNDGASHDVTAAYQGNADFTGSSSLVSRADPTITASLSAQGGGASAAGWWHTPVTVSFTCTPHGSALTTACPAPVTLATSGADQSVVRTITAEDGGTATVTLSDIDIDLVGPTVTIKGVKAGKTYPKKKKPTCEGADALSGLASCSITQVKSGKKYVVTATATDQAGNVTTATLTYKVKKPNK